MGKEEVTNLGLGRYLSPWPWDVDADYIGGKWTDSLSIKAANGGHVAHLTRGVQANDDGDGCPSWTNARLIAAAPELLYACILTLEACEKGHAIDLKVLEKAVAKAGKAGTEAPAPES